MKKIKEFFEKRYVSLRKTYWKYFPLSWQISINRYLCKHYYKHIGNHIGYEINKFSNDVWESCEECGYARIIHEGDEKVS